MRKQLDSRHDQDPLCLQPFEKYLYLTHAPLPVDLSKPFTDFSNDSVDGATSFTEEGGEPAIRRSDNVLLGVELQ